MAFPNVAAKGEAGTGQRACFEQIAADFHLATKCGPDSQEQCQADDCATFEQKLWHWNAENMS